MSIALYAAFFDTSALAKLYLEEPGSDALRQFWHGQSTRYSTTCCMYETLGILKHALSRGTISRPEYLKHATHLVSYFRAGQSKTQDLDFTDREVFNDAKKLAEDTGLDLSDSFQLLTLQAGAFSVLVGGSQSVLVTGDEALATAARNRKLRVLELPAGAAPSLMRWAK
jgi:predicted nucleic acid-binding protein